MNEGDVNMSDSSGDISNEFTADYYDKKYFVDLKGKEFHRPDGSVDYWGYRNPDGHWEGCGPIVFAWKNIFNPRNMLDVGCGRGQFTAAARRAGIEAYGFDYSQWAIGNKYIDCDAAWITCRDVTTIPWIYGDKSFDLVIVLDLFEHLYQEDIDKVIDELYRVVNRLVFLQIATVKNVSEEYVLKRGEKVPVDLEGMAVAGHVTVKSKDFWINKLMRDGNGNERKEWRLRDDLVAEFIKKVDPAIIDNWVKNSILILEKV